MSTRLSRRQWLATGAAGLAVAPLGSSLLWARPPVKNPRATDGDDRHEPDWTQRLTITVGHQGADLNGRDDKVVQAALDYVARLGGGTVHVRAGKYVFRNAVQLPSGVRLRGDGADTILTKIPSTTIALADDSDWYDQEVTLKNAKGFRVGDGVVLITKNPHNGSQDVIKRTLVAQKGNRFKLSDGIRKNLWLTGKPTCSTMFPLLTSENTADVVIENLALDGDKKNNMNLNGNYAGNIFLQDCNRYTIRGVESREYNGDGISFQICHDVVVENCYSHDNANLGVHPGSGSQRPVLLNNRLERNTIGIFWCWGVKFGLAEGNRIVGNRNFGISIGHCDTDNVMRNNEVIDSGKVGIL
ncbi:MAG: right-handed parallel beta-helix repeat-containing protein, partial [Pirellulaceae bacterium]|nr:right-handed parallel beta-helix repeat-containing protein [Pirellulaceae bacterium]